MLISVSMTEIGDNHAAIIKSKPGGQYPPMVVITGSKQEDVATELAAVLATMDAKEPLAASYTELD